MDQDQRKKSAIAVRLSLARKQAGLSQAQVAKILGLHRPAISEAEAGRRNISASEIAKLSEVYGVGVDWLTCSDTDHANEARDRIQLAARELSKLKKDDLEKVIGLLSALRQGESR